MRATAAVRGALLTLLVWIASASGAFAASVTLVWDPILLPEVTGYRIRYGTASGVYTTTIDVDNVTSYYLDGFDVGRTYFFVVEASAAGVYSDPSNELVITFNGEGADDDTAAPRVVSVVPDDSSTLVSPATTIAVTFSKAIDPATVSTGALELRAFDTVVPGTLSYEPVTRTATLTPSQPLMPLTVYSAIVRGAGTGPAVADLAGNTLAADVTFAFTTAPPAAVPDGFVDTTPVDFGAGTTGSNTAIVAIGDGELTLAPAVAQQFDDGSLPSEWMVAPWVAEGTALVGGGFLTVDGARAGTGALVEAGRSLEFVGAFSGGPNQHLGFSVDYTRAPWAVFSTAGDDGQLHVLTSDGNVESTAIVPGSWFGTLHRYRIEWRDSTIDYFIDDVLVASHPFVAAHTMRPLVSDFLPGNGSLRIDSMHLRTPSGSFRSRVFDAGTAVTWGAAGWTSAIPAGTGLTISVRAGSTAIPDGSWSAFAVLPESNLTVGLTSRYLQYQALLSSSSVGQSPVLEQIAIALEPPPDTTMPLVRITSPAPDAMLANVATVSAWASDDVGVAGLRFTVDGADAGVEQDTPPYALEIDTTALTDGTHTISARARDAAGNTAWAPDVVVVIANGPPPDPPPPAATFVDTTSADFAAGARESTLVGDAGDGEVVLAPSERAEFEGSNPEGWSATPWYPGGTAVPSDGRLIVDGARLGSDALRGGGRSFEFVATFSGDYNEHVGFAVDFTAPPWAVFSTGPGDGALHVFTSDGAASHADVIPGDWLRSPHRFRVEWSAGSVAYWIDGAEVASHPISPLAVMRPIASDFMLGAGQLTLEWLRVSPYAPAGSFVSRVFDAGTISAWGTASWTGAEPPGTTLRLHVRSGNTPQPDASWSAFTPIAASGDPIGMLARYLQYRADFATTSPERTAELHDITFTAMVPPPDVSPPTLTVTAPAIAAGIVTLTVDALDDVGVAGVQLVVDGADFGAELTAPPYSVTWDTRVVADGSHTVSAWARDAAGNVGLATSVGVAVANDVTSPTISLASPRAGTAVTGTIALSATASDDVAVVGVQFLLDGVEIGAECTTAPYALVWNAAGLPGGQHTVSARARDAAGHTAVVAVKVLKKGK